MVLTFCCLDQFWILHFVKITGLYLLLPLSVVTNRDELLDMGCGTKWISSSSTIIGGTG